MCDVFQQGDLVQSINGGPVMRVVSIFEDPAGETVVSTVLADGRAAEPGRHHASTLKIVGVLGDDDDLDGDGENGLDDDRGD